MRNSDVETVHQRLVRIHHNDFSVEVSRSGTGDGYICSFSIENWDDTRVAYSCEGNRLTFYGPNNSIKARKLVSRVIPQIIEHIKSLDIFNVSKYEKLKWQLTT